MANIAFIGLGNMGGGMAANLLKAGYSVTAFDLIEDNLNAFAALGGNTASSALEAVNGAEVIISMLPAGKHVDGLYLGTDTANAAEGGSGILKHIDPTALVLDCSTIDVATVQKVAAAAKDLGIAYVDAPVSGGVAAAAAGSLTFMCGGKAEHIDRARPTLEAMGKAVFHAGDNGAGQVAKMCNNMLLAVHMIGTAEALQMGANNGLDPKVLSEIMLASSGRNWSLEVYNPHPGVMETAPASNDYQPGFMVDLMLKDLGLAMENSTSSSSEVPMGELAHKLYQALQEDGKGAKDFSCIAERFA